MVNIYIKLAAIWVSLMLVYFLGDVLRIFSGDFKESGIAGKQISKNMYLGISMIMVLPIFMVLLTLFLDYQPNRILNMVVAAFFFIFNLVGLPTYPSAYDKFLIIVGLGFNLLTIYLAWNWILA